MTSVFKFAKRQFVEEAVALGRIRLSHVATFRVEDGISDGRADSDEMSASATIADGDKTISSEDPRFDGMFTFIRGGKRVPTDMVVAGDSMKLIGSGLLFCASLENSDALFQRMAETFGVDAAYEITDVDEFARRVARLPADLGFADSEAFEHRSGPVSYYDLPKAPSIAEMPGIDPFRKPARYEWQKEHRVLFRPYEASDYVDVELPALTELLRIVR